MELIDSHTHLYLGEFDDDRRQVVERAVGSGVTKLFLPNIDSSTIGPLLEMRNAHPGICFPMAGLHPTSVKSNYRDELRIVSEYLGKENFIAIGEIGIDLYWDKTYQKEQEEAFARQIEWAEKFDLPVVIHARNSFREIFEVLDKHFFEGLRGVFHSFTGGKEEVLKIREYGFSFGINGIVTFRNSGLDKVVEDIPPEKILLETDAPFLAPVPKRGRRNESQYLKYIAQKLADVYSLTLEDLAEISTRNALNLFKTVRNG